VMNANVTTSTRVAACQSTQEPDRFDVSDIIWGSVQLKAIGLRARSTLPADPPGTIAGACCVGLQALRTDDRLFLRLTWPDTSQSVWRSRYQITSPTPPVTFSHDTTYFFEDQLYVMFGGAPTGWDCWNWRALTTGAGNLAQGISYVPGVTAWFSPDEGDGSFMVENPPRTNSQQPVWVHKDTSEFYGHIMYVDDTLENFEWTTGWSLGQRVPGWMVDSSEANLLHELPRESLWDIDAGQDFLLLDFDAVNTVVLSRDLNTGFAEDLNMAARDSVQVQLWVLNNLDWVDRETSARKYTSTFWLILD
jgi:hypothetical protein